MKLPSIAAAACAIAALPMLAGSVAAAPVAPNLALSASDTGVVQDVQYRRWRGGWRTYAYAPRGYYPRAYRSQFPAARCGDADRASAYPSWACPANPRATGW